MLDIIDKALRFAAKAHSGQTRKKDTKLPYIYHPTMTGFYLLKYNYSEEVVAAAILHDVIEDTAIENEELELEFGKKITTLVLACTEDKEETWKDRKQHQIDLIRTTDIEVLGIKCADKLHNISDTYREFESEGENVWSTFTGGKESQKWYYTELKKAFAERKEINSSEMFLEFKNKVEFLFTGYLGGK